MKEKSIAINAGLNTIKTCLSIIFPLITYPYAMRVLQAEGIGKVSYAESIVSYYTLIASLGISTYAIREGAKIRGDKKKINEFSNEIFSINILTTIIAYMLLGISLLLVSKFSNYKYLILLESVSIFLTTIGVDWINTIYEDYLFITIRSIVSHIISLIFLFVFVKDSNDYYYYAAITVLVNGVICVSNLFYCRRYVHFKFRLKNNIKKHIKPMLILFANNLAVTIYVSADTTMLGWMSGDYYVGIYATTVKIYNVAKRLMVAMYSVTIPRLSHYLGIGEKKKFKDLYTKVLNYIILLLLPTSTGLIVLSKEVIYVMAGTGYSEAVLTLQILGLSLVCAIFGGAITSCLNIPLGREAYNMKATIISAAINIGLNILFIPLFKQNGAAITTVISELFVPIYCLLTFEERNEYINFDICKKMIMHALVGVITIVFYNKIICALTSNYIIIVGFTVVCSITTYILELVALKNPYIFQAFEVIKSKKFK